MPTSILGETIIAATLLRCEVGSGAHGIATSGQDDRDEMGICLEPMPLAWTTEPPFEQYIYRTAAEREGRQDAPSMPGDLDLTIYSLRKWARLALAGNPTVILPLFGTPLSMNAHGSRLREMADAFASKQAIKKYLGYLAAQRERLNGTRGQKNVNRQNLVEKYGYDTKYAGHMVRLGYQGIEYAETGRLTLPMAEPMRSRILDIRQGRVTQADATEECLDVESKLTALLVTSPLPSHPDTTRVNKWMQETYLTTWHSDYSDNLWRELGYQQNVPAGP